MKMNILYTYSIIVLLNTFSISGSFAQNDEIDDDQDYMFNMSMEELMNIEVVTASQTAQKISDAPATIHVVTEEQIRDRGYRNLEELLEDIPEIEIQRKSVAEYSNYYSFRGISGNEKFMILLDGIRINSMAGTPHVVGANYSVMNAKRVEIVLGPASALYGVDAFSGIINIITREGNDIKGGDLAVNYGSFNTLDLNGSVGVGNENISLNISGSFTSSDEPAFPDYYSDEYSWYINNYKEDGSMRLAPFAPDVIIPTGSPQTYETPSMAYTLYTGIKMKDFDFGYSRNFESHSSSVGMKPDYNIYAKEAQFNTVLESFYAKHSFSTENEKLNIQSNLSRGSYELTPESQFQNTFTNYNSGYKYAQHTSFLLREQLTYNISDGHTIITGFSLQDVSALPKTGDLPFEYNKDSPEALQNIYYIGTNTNDLNGNDLTIMQDFYHIKQRNYGSFFQYQGDLGSILKLTAGLRYDFNTRYGSSLNPRLGTVISATKNLKFKLLYGQAFLAPSVYKAFQHYGAFLPVDANDNASFDSSTTTRLSGPFWHLSNPDLKPEKLQTIEFGTSYFQGVFGVSGDAYYNLIDNLIVAELEFGQPFQGVIVDAVERPVNKGKATTYGFTGRLDYIANFGKINLQAYLVYSYSDGDVDGAPLPFSAKNTVKFGALLKGEKFSVNPRIIYRTESLHPTVTDTNGDPESNDAFMLVNLYAKYQITDFISINVKVNNLLDSRYYNISLAQEEGFAATPQDPIKIMGGVNFTLRK